MKPSISCVALALLLEFLNSSCHTPCDASNPLVVESVVSRKAHGSPANTFGIDLPLSGTPGIECRNSTDFTLVFTFSNGLPNASLREVKSASVSVGTGNVVSQTISGMQCIVNLSNVTSPQTIVVTLEGVHDAKHYINVSVPLSVLVGDTTASGSVDDPDIRQLKASSGVQISASNFRADLTLDGAIDGGDVSLAQAKNGTALPRLPSALPRLEVCRNDPKFICRADETGQFFWLGDTGWWLMNLSDADVSHYLSTRVAQGFNGIQIMALMLEAPGIAERALHDKRDFYLSSPTDDKGNLISPLCPNSAYWARFRWIIEEAERKGLYVGVFLVHGSEIGRSKYFRDSTAQAHDYARDLATLLRNNSNVWYSVSVEYDAIHNFEPEKITAAQFAMFDSLAQGLRAGSQGSAILRGIHPGRPQTSVLQFAPGGGCGGAVPCHPGTWLDFHMLQSGHNSKRAIFRGFQIKQTDELIDQGYALTTPKPIFDGEPIYENSVDGAWNDDSSGPNSPRADASLVRFKAYEAVFAGAFGHTYGHENTVYLWSANTGDDPNRPFTRNISWQRAINASGATQLKHLRRLMECHSQNRIPDQTMLPDEPASYEGLTHKRATRESGGSAKYALVYLPQGGPVKVRVTNLANDWKARWFNPENGAYAAATHVHDKGNDYNFTPPEPLGKDWVLVFESQGFPTCDR